MVIYINGAIEKERQQLYAKKYRLSEALIVEKSGFYPCQDSAEALGLALSMV